MIHLSLFCCYMYRSWHKLTVEMFSTCSSLHEDIIKLQVSLSYLENSLDIRGGIIVVFLYGKVKDRLISNLQESNFKWICRYNFSCYFFAICFIQVVAHFLCCPKLNLKLFEFSIVQTASKLRLWKEYMSLLFYIWVFDQNLPKCAFCWQQP